MDGILELSDKIGFFGQGVKKLNIQFPNSLFQKKGSVTANTEYNYSNGLLSGLSKFRDLTMNKPNEGENGTVTATAKEGSGLNISVPSIKSYQMEHTFSQRLLLEESREAFALSLFTSHLLRLRKDLNSLMNHDKSLSVTRVEDL